MAPENPPVTRKDLQKALFDIYLEGGVQVPITDGGRAALTDRLWAKLCSPEHLTLTGR